MIQVFHFSVGISDTATTVQVAVQTPPSRRRGAAKTQTKLVKKIKKYDFGLDIDPIDTKLRPQSNQIMPQGKKFKQILFHQLFIFLSNMILFKIINNIIIDYSYTLERKIKFWTKYK